MFVGEAPGQQEDATGRPFVGLAGQLLNAWIAAIGLRREGVYIANTVKCRPLENRDPYPTEKETCAPFLHTQIFLVRPKVLVALGRHAAHSLAETDIAMKSLRGADLHYRNAQTGVAVPVVATYHPSYVLRKGRGEPEQEVLADLRRAVTLGGLSTGQG
jgi:DNA polymerase